MNSRTAILGIAAVGVSSLALATPVIPEDGVTIRQNANHVVTVSYTLGDGQNQEPAIVTVDFETNVTGTAEGPWVSIGERNFRNVDGFVNKVVEPGARTITWRPRRTWPDHVIAGGNFRARVKAWAKSCPPDYMAINLLAPGLVNYYTSTNALPFDLGDDICRTEILLMRKIPAANVEWRMGAPTTENGYGVKGGNFEATHYVTLTKDYYMGVFPVTRYQYAVVQGADCSALAKPCQAHVGISWNGARYGSDNTKTVAGTSETWPVNKAVNQGSFIYNIRQRTGIASFDLPTSAQWEFACRAGTSSALYNGKELASANPKDVNAVDESLADIAWYNGNCHGVLPDHVGLLQPNGWGLYDLYGSVYEWCLDFSRGVWEASEVDPEGPTSGTQRFQVGGVNNDRPAICRSAFRMGRDPGSSYLQYEIFGFRIQCDAVAP